MPALYHCPPAFQAIPLPPRELTVHYKPTLRESSSRNSYTSRLVKDSLDDGKHSQRQQPNDLAHHVGASELREGEQSLMVIESSGGIGVPLKTEHSTSNSNSSNLLSSTQHSAPLPPLQAPLHPESSSSSFTAVAAQGTAKKRARSRSSKASSAEQVGIAHRLEEQASLKNSKASRSDSAAVVAPTTSGGSAVARKSRSRTLDLSSSDGGAAASAASSSSSSSFGSLSASSNSVAQAQNVKRQTAGDPLLQAAKNKSYLLGSAAETAENILLYLSEHCLGGSEISSALYSLLFMQQSVPDRYE